MPCQMAHHSVILGHFGEVGQARMEIDEKITQVAYEMSKTTIFRAKPIANAMRQMCGAGLTVEESIVALPDVVNAAAQSGEPLDVFVGHLMSLFVLYSTLTIS